ncbi:MAG: ATP:cob(I)alamin adenosyltransferase [Archaeoglobus sp.]|uniref:ATP:cob(I)alamin adenosyltransferase n=1 Tax=Archaeoglobus sp. TaxID=1872626 RepID=UPI001D95C75F|nr:ATP:cob(I)alamin adenosyltransferase [Archaeoglobus sp.]MBO8179460.1 ATP:cob(I)alamin adenosyltransferase [Archaeoglobus sp.]
MLAKDSSLTRTGKGEVVDKDSSFTWYVGTVDEANSFIGLARVFSNDEKVKETLLEVQKRLFAVGAEPSHQKLEEEDLEWLLKKVEEFENAVKKPNRFIILEKDEATAFLSVARAVVRRAEREAVRLYREGKVRLLTVEWLNKLSYLLYLMILKEGEGEFEEV